VAYFVFLCLEYNAPSFDEVFLGLYERTAFLPDKPLVSGLLLFRQEPGGEGCSTKPRKPFQGRKWAKVCSSGYTLWRIEPERILHPLNPRME
jgi:hypothetical protein